MQDWQLASPRKAKIVLSLLGLLSCSAMGQSSADSRIWIDNLVHTDRKIRFDLRNNSSSAVTFMQLRREAACPDGTVVPTGSWGTDAQ